MKIQYCYRQHEGFTLEHRVRMALKDAQTNEAAQVSPCPSGAAPRVVSCRLPNAMAHAGTVTCLHCGGTNLGPLSGSGPGVDRVGLEGR